MSKIGLIIGREYFTRVKKKSFLITTILVPLVIMGFYAIIVAVAMKGNSSDSKQRIGIIDEAGIFSDTAIKNIDTAKYKIVTGETEETFVKKYKDQGLFGFLYIPKFNLNKPDGIVMHSQSSVGLSRTMAIESMVSKAVFLKRLQILGIDPEKYKDIDATVNVQSTIDTKDGSKKSIAGLAYIVSFACGILIYMMMIIYGTQVMRGVTEEKTNRIAEVVVSSVKPFELMMGKIVGIGLVGLTQFAIWIILVGILQSLLPLFMPDMMQQMGGDGATAVKSGIMAQVSEGLSTLPLLKIGFLFIFYFIFGYLTYASLFAAVGSVVSEDQQEAQQLVFPILMPIILGFVIMTRAIDAPDSSMAVFGSLFPLTSPVVMMGRVTYAIPIWQIAVSAILLIGTFLLLTWLTAKIYRTGILMYGKKPSWKEMMKWAFRKQ